MLEIAGGIVMAFVVIFGGGALLIFAGSVIKDVAKSSTHSTARIRGTRPATRKEQIQMLKWTGAVTLLIIAIAAVSLVLQG